MIKNKKNFKEKKDQYFIHKTNKNYTKMYYCLCLIIGSAFLFLGCYNTGTQLNNKYFKNNDSDIIVIDSPNNNATNSDNKSDLVTITTIVANAVAPAVVAISAEGSGYISVGSGVSVKSGGYILTNHHVIENAKKINLHLFDNTIASAIVLWQDKTSDIAILKSDIAVPYLNVGKNSDLLLGQDVIAVGTPLSLNFNHTFTKGIISALNRTIKTYTDGAEMLMNNLIQHDASLNSGNSGGPLIDMSGKVIGINTLKIGNAEGLGFAIPIDAVSVVIDRVYNNYNYSAPYFGVVGYDASINDSLINFGDVNADSDNTTILSFNNEKTTNNLLNSSNDLTSNNGATNNNIDYMTNKEKSDNHNERNSNIFTVNANFEKSIGYYITDVDIDSPAYLAGIRSGDIIVAINDYKVKNALDFKIALYSFSAYESINVTYVRNGQTHFTHLTLLANRSLMPNKSETTLS